MNTTNCCWLSSFLVKERILYSLFIAISILSTATRPNFWCSLIQVEGFVSANKALSDFSFLVRNRIQSVLAYHCYYLLSRFTIDDVISLELSNWGKVDVEPFNEFDRAIRSSLKSGTYLHFSKIPVRFDENIVTPFPIIVSFLAKVYTNLCSKDAYCSRKICRETKDRSRRKQVRCW